MSLVSCGHKKTNTHLADAKDWPDEQLLDTVQYQTFQYFWDGAEPNSGMACERIHTDGEYPELTLRDANAMRELDSAAV